MSRETPLMTVQDDDAEMVVVETDGNITTLHFDDGRTVVFDRLELHSATALERTVRAVRSAA